MDFRVDFQPQIFSPFFRLWPRSKSVTNPSFPLENTRQRIGHKSVAKSATQLRRVPYMMGEVSTQNFWSLLSTPPCDPLYKHFSEEQEAHKSKLLALVSVQATAGTAGRLTEHKGSCVLLDRNQERLACFAE